MKSPSTLRGSLQRTLKQEQSDMQPPIRQSIYNSLSSGQANICNVSRIRKNLWMSLERSCAWKQSSPMLSIPWLLLHPDIMSAWSHEGAWQAWVHQCSKWWMHNLMGRTSPSFWDPKFQRYHHPAGSLANEAKQCIWTQEVSKWKARLNINESCLVKGCDYWDTYAPVATWGSICLILATAIVQGWHSNRLTLTWPLPKL